MNRHVSAQWFMPVIVCVIVTLLVLVLAPRAHAAGSDSVTPYAVTVDGITLPEVETFLDNGHVNIRYSADGVESSAGLHFEGKCVTRTDAECAGARHEAAQFIGKSFMPWSAFGLTGSFCVTWVQISQFNEHFGEGGQNPICVGVVPTSSPEPTDSPSPSPEPTVTASPSPEPTTAPAPPTSRPLPSPEATTIPEPANGQPPVGELAATGTELWGIPASLLLVAAGITLLVRRRHS